MWEGQQRPGQLRVEEGQQRLGQLLFLQEV